MTTGEQLKKALGLEKLKNVKVNRALVSSYKTLFVWFDSYRPQMPVTNYRIRNFPQVATIFSGTDLYHGTDKGTVFTPPIDIEKYNGMIRGTLVIPVNLAGDRFITKKQFSKVFESKKNNYTYYLLTEGFLKEFVTLQDLADSGNISDFTRDWWKDRTRIMKGASQNIKLVDCIINESDKSVTFQFLTEATRLGNKNPNDNIDSDYRFYDGSKGETDPENNWRITRNRSEVYEIQIKVLEVLGDEGWLSTFEGEKIGRKEMKEILEVSNVQISSTSPSFNWQGFAYWLTQIDASIYPQSIAPTSGPKGWKDRHGDGNAFLDKHTYSLLQGIDFFVNQMAVKLTSKLRQRGLI